MKTTLTKIEELKPDDKVFVERTPDTPNWHTLPEVLTVRRVEKGSVFICETGGLVLKAAELHKVIEPTEPEHENNSKENQKLTIF